MKCVRSSMLIKTPYRCVGYFKLAEERNLTSKDPQLLVSEQYGFLPREAPLFNLPTEFAKVEEILNRAPFITPDGKVGLLADGKFGETVLKELPLIDVSKYEDSRIVEALMRDYSYLAAMYLLEPCDINFRKTKEYGLGRDHLPESIAIPLCKVAEKLNVKPILEYTQYILYNWIRKDPKAEFSPDNLISPRNFHGSKDELWFKVIHLYMDQHSGKLVKKSIAALKAVEENDRTAFDKALSELAENSKIIVQNLDHMWSGTQPDKYNNYRTFIFGIKDQPMFPNGVVYKGVSPEPRFYRGETGANDSMIPTLDNLFEVTASMPKNPLSETLREFRTYRPSNHREFVDWVEEKAKEVHLKNFACQDSNSTVLYMKNLNYIAEFRELHWRLTKEFIIKHSKHPRATGGSPITTWLPNQLGVVLGVIEEVGKKVDVSKLTPENKALEIELVKRASTLRKILEREVDELKQQFPNQDK